MSKRYVLYVEDGKRPPKGAVELVGTFFQEEDVALAYESWVDGREESDPRYAAHEPHTDGLPTELGEWHPCWDALTQEQRDAYLEKAGKYLENACTYDWVEIIEIAISDTEGGDNL